MTFQGAFLHLRGFGEHNPISFLFLPVRHSGILEAQQKANLGINTTDAWQK